MEIAYLADYPDFAPTLAEWHYQEWNRLRANDSVARRLDSLKERSNRRQIPSVHVAVEDGKLLGSATVAEYDMETRRDLTPWMTDVFVAPEFRRRGIASALVLRIMREAKAIGVPQLYLFTTGPWRERLYAGTRLVGYGPPHLPGYRASPHDYTSLNATFLPDPSIAACAAASRATGIRYGEHDT